MGRPSRLQEQRSELLPLVAGAFAELGYRRATTRELARRCGVQENILYRHWPDKRAMFVAAIRHVYERSAQTWRDLLHGAGGEAGAAQRLLQYEARHHGEFGLYRILFAGLSETDDPEIRSALADTYRRFHRLLARQVTAAAEGRPAEARAESAAWAFVGLGTVANIGRELGLLSAPARRRLFEQVGRRLLDGLAGE